MIKMAKRVFEALNWASSFLESEGSEKTAAEILLRHHLDVSRSQLFASFHDEIPLQKWQRFQADVHRFAEGVPVQYLTGVEHFYGRVFSVNQEVLIPRPETEELVVGALERVDEHFPKTDVLDLVDIGTGSGAIAVTLALESEQFRVTATDIAESSLAVAKGNSERLGANIRFLQGDLLQPLIELGQKVDCLVSNPPYIPLTDADTLHPRVRDYEPSRALFGGEDGLLLYRRLIQQLPAVIKERGLVALEVGIGQAEVVAKMLSDVLSNANVEIAEDINGKQRLVFARW